VTFVGLAKNTGKTEALATLVGELSRLGRPLAITSIGRDGEEVDVIQPRIAKPRIDCPKGALIATTAPLISRCAAPHEVLVDTGLRTPLGSVVIARLHGSAEIEVAGPSTSTGIRAVVDAMLGLGAEHALIDGAIDRRAASAPSVADVVVLSTGAVLGREIDEVVRRTARAVELIDLPRVTDPRLRELAVQAGGDAILTEAGEVRTLPARFALTADRAEIAAALQAGDDRHHALVIGGSITERFLDALLRAAASRRTRVIVADTTKVFLQTRSPRWYSERGLCVEVLRWVDLRAITANPVAPLSHSFDSAELLTAIAEIAPGVPVFDVRSHAYRDAARHVLSIA
jgi:hypothetical protein